MHNNDYNNDINNNVRTVLTGDASSSPRGNAFSNLSDVTKPIDNPATGFFNGTPASNSAIVALKSV